MIPLLFTLEWIKPNELITVFDSVSQTCFAVGTQSAELLMLTAVWGQGGEKSDDLEIRPVLLQLGVVHVNRKQLETGTNSQSV